LIDKALSKTTNAIFFILYTKRNKENGYAGARLSLGTLPYDEGPDEDENCSNDIANADIFE
jgi:hypothetical protein